MFIISPSWMILVHLPQGIATVKDEFGCIKDSLVIIRLMVRDNDYTIRPAYCRHQVRYASNSQVVLSLQCRDVWSLSCLIRLILISMFFVRRCSQSKGLSSFAIHLVCSALPTFLVEVRTSLHYHQLTVRCLARPQSGAFFGRWINPSSSEASSPPNTN
jgi:hypothetical protein